jgi:hypothetical protein
MRDRVRSHYRAAGRRWIVLRMSSVDNLGDAVRTVLSTKVAGGFVATMLGMYACTEK